MSLSQIIRLMEWIWLHLFDNDTHPSGHCMFMKAGILKKIPHVFYEITRAFLRKSPVNSKSNQWLIATQDWVPPVRLLEDSNVSSGDTLEILQPCNKPLEGSPGLVYSRSSAVVGLVEYGPSCGVHTLDDQMIQHHLLLGTFNDVFLNTVFGH